MGHAAPFITTPDGPAPLTRAADLRGREHPQDPGGLKLTARSAVYVQRLAQKNQVPPSTILAAAAILVTGISSVYLATQPDVILDTTDALSITLIPLLAAALGALSVIWQILHSQRLRRQKAEFQSPSDPRHDHTHPV